MEDSKINSEILQEKLTIKKEPEDIPDLISVESIEFEESRSSCILNTNNPSESEICRRDALLTSNFQLGILDKSKVIDKTTMKNLSLSKTKIKRMFKCPICRKDLPSSSKNKHVKNHFEKSFATCFFCGKAFIKIREYSKHFRLHLIKIIKKSSTKQAEVETYRKISKNGYVYKNKDQDTICTICCKEFSSSGNLKTHLSIHSGIKPFECTVCFKGFRIKHNLAKHMVTHEAVKPLACPSCPRRFCTKQQLQLHFRMHTGENQQRSFPCTNCGKTFANNYYLKLHMKTHTSPAELTCDICYKSFSCKRNLQRHANVHSGQKSHQCEVCFKTFSNKFILTAHLEFHENPDQLKCEICLRQLSDKRNLARHMRLHTGENTSYCEVCHKPYSTKIGLQRHFQEVHIREKPLECHDCSKKFATKDSLSAHVKIHSNVKRYFCSICNCGYTNRSSLRYHVATHSRSVKLKCADCPKKFNSQTDLDAHSCKNVYISKPFKCELCSKTYTTRGSLLTHKQRIHEITPVKISYKCEVCFKIFWDSFSLKVHSTVHTNEKPYKCTNCSKRFRIKGNLKKHLKIHEEVKPFQCDLCPFSATCKSNLLRHIDIHKGVTFECNICSRKLAHKPGLKRHMLRIHFIDVKLTKNTDFMKFESDDKELVSEKLYEDQKKQVETNFNSFVEVKIQIPNDPLDNCKNKFNTTRDDLVTELETHIENDFSKDITQIETPAKLEHITKGMDIIKEELLLDGIKQEYTSDEG